MPSSACKKKIQSIINCILLNLSPCLLLYFHTYPTRRSSDLQTEHLAIGCFGASTGAAAALVAGAKRRDKVAAVVSRGGRPDLAGHALSLVRCPRSEEHTSELQSRRDLVCRLLLVKKKYKV